MSRIRSEIAHAVRGELRLSRPAESDSLEQVYEWHGWGAAGNVRAICERWEALEASPEELLELYENVRGERDRFGAAFISLTQNQRKLVRWVFLEEQPKAITQAARDLGVSYYQAIRMLARALVTMRRVFVRMEANNDTALEAV